MDSISHDGDCFDLLPASPAICGGAPGRGALLLLAVLVVTAGCHNDVDLESSERIVEVTSANFKAEVLEARQPVLVEFWAPWCQPCIEMAPALEQVARDHQATAKVARIRIDTHPQLAERYEVEGPPVLILFQQGEVIKRRYGKQTAEQLAELISGSL